MWDVLAVLDGPVADPTCPVMDFLSDHQATVPGQVAGILTTIENFSTSGLELITSEQCHNVNDDATIWQFRRGRLRILWFYGEDGRVIICSHGFFKNTQKTPKHEVRRAEAARAAYLAAKLANQISIKES